MLYWAYLNLKKLNLKQLLVYFHIELSRVEASRDIDVGEAEAVKAGPATGGLSPAELLHFRLDAGHVRLGVGVSDVNAEDGVGFAAHFRLRPHSEYP